MNKKIKPFEYLIIQANSAPDFAKKCEVAHEDGFLFVGQLVITGLGQGKFLYSQQWFRSNLEEIEKQKLNENKED